MNLDKIRKMNDEQLKKFINNAIYGRNTTCHKCCKLDANYTIYINNKREYQQHKLCKLCDDCYSELLDYLKVDDINW